MKKCVLIYNPKSGKKERKKHLPKMKEIIEEKGYSCDIIFTEYHGHATEIMSSLEEDVDLVISAGGDGTFNEVMTGNIKRKKRLLLAHLPVGTTNDVGAMMGYGKNIIENLKMTLNGVKKKMDICTINDNPFVYVSTIGKFADVPYETPRDMKKKFGYLAYLVQGIKAFNRKTSLMDLTFEINGEKHRGLYSFIIISSANRIAGINDFYKDVKLDDDKFEVLLCSIAKKKDIIKSLYFLALYGAEKVPGFEFYKTNNFKMKFADVPKKDWCVDGEKLDSKVLTYEIKNINNVEVLLPKKNINKLFINKD